MSVIIRLQNLPWSANALDIRQYFQGLSIPEGGVHIVGGELGDAFIAFSTDEDARQAFQLNGGKIKEIQVKLLLSSRSEMHKVIEAARNAQMPFAVAPSVVPQSASLHQAAITTNTSKPLQQLNQDGKDENNKDKTKDDSRSRRDKERRRSRSRSRDRRDRSRDRRDRRRRDRSRSRDRRDRRRRDRSRSRERTRSKERDTQRSRDRRDKSRTPDRIVSADNKFPLNNRKDQIKPKVWEQNIQLPQQQIPNMPIQNNLLNTPFPSQLSNFENARRTLGLVQELQNKINNANKGNNSNLMPDKMDVFQRQSMTPLMSKDWNKRPPNRFERNPPLLENTGLGLNQFQPALNRPMMMSNSSNNMSMDNIRPNFFQNQNLRPPFVGNMMGMNNRPPFLNRPPFMQPDPFRSDRSDRSERILDINDDIDDFRRDPNKLNKSGCCIKMRPYYGGYGDLKKFFHGLYIDNNGVKFLHDSNGKKTGEIFVKFIRPEHKELALKKSGFQMRGYKVEISHVDESEFTRCEIEDEEKEVEGENHVVVIEDDESNEISTEPYSCIIIENIPTYTKEHDILKMCSEYSMRSIHLINQKNRHVAYVQFAEAEDARKVLENKNNHVVCGRPVIVNPCQTTEFNEMTHQEIPTVEMEVAPEKEPEPATEDHEDSNEHVLETDDSATDVVLLSDLPNKTTDRDIIDFFSDVGLVPNRIHMLPGKFGAPGECYCEFGTPEEAITAVDKDGMPLGPGTIRVVLFSRSEMERNLGFSQTGPGMNNNSGPMNPRFMNRFGPGPGPRGGGMMGRMPPNMMRRRPFFNKPENLPDGNMGPPGCVVSMENVPFKSGVKDIINFFDGFNIPAHNVFRRYSDNGKPTGDARVVFPTPGEARRAITELRFQKIQDRIIYLNVL